MTRPPAGFLARLKALAFHRPPQKTSGSRRQREDPQHSGGLTPSQTAGGSGPVVGHVGVEGDSPASEQSESGFIRGGNKVGSATVGNPKFPGAIEVFKYVESGIWAPRNDARDLVSSNPVNLPVGRQAHNHSCRQYSAGSQGGKGPVHTAFVSWAGDGPRLGLPAMASTPQGDGAGHEDEDAERRQQPLHQKISPAGTGIIPFFNLIANTTATLLWKSQPRISRISRMGRGPPSCYPCNPCNPWSTLRSVAVVLVPFSASNAMVLFCATPFRTGDEILNLTG